MRSLHRLKTVRFMSETENIFAQIKENMFIIKFFIIFLFCLNVLIEESFAHQDIVDTGLYPL